MQKPITRVAIAGHRLHGKTALLGAIMQLAGRGGPPSGSFALETAQRHFTFLEVREGAEELARLFGEAPSNALLLVISADDGVMEGTRDVVQWARKAGVQKVIVFLNKCDKVEDVEMLDLIEMEVRELLNRFKLDGDAALVARGAAGVSGHSQWGEAVAQVLAALDRAG
jgi:elongation factor Tu